MINHSLLYGDVYPLNNGMVIKNPSVQEVLNFGEDKYHVLINLFLIYPVDCLLDLYEMCNSDIDVFHPFFNSMTQYDLFFMMYRQGYQRYNEMMSFFFEGGVNFLPYQNRETNEKFLFDEEKKMIFNITSFTIMSNYIMAINNIKETNKMVTKSKMLLKAEIRTEQDNSEYLKKERERDRLAGKNDNRLQKLITKIVVASRFNRDNLQKMKIYEFYKIVGEVVGFIYWGFRMGGLYSGNVSLDKMKAEQKRQYTEWFYD